MMSVFGHQKTSGTADNSRSLTPHNNTHRPLTKTISSNHDLSSARLTISEAFRFRMGISTIVLSI